MKHSACGGWWEIRTDSQNSEYVVVEGARRRDYGPAGKGDEALAEGDLKFLTEEEKQKRREDAFANLEGKIEEKGNEKKNRERVEELYDKAEVWRDPYEINAKLRREFREKRRVWKKEDKYKEGMQEKFSLGLDIMDETEADRTRARLIEFGTKGTDGGIGDRKIEDLEWKPLFMEAKTEDKATDRKALQQDFKPRKLKAELAKEKRRQGLQQTLVGNTRAVIDPFLHSDSMPVSKVNLGILKRKRDDETKDEVAITSVSGQERKKIDADMATRKPASFETDANTPTKNSALLKALAGYESE
jgi:coiled-coil domain-containing protein 130